MLKFKNAIACPLYIHMCGILLYLVTLYIYMYTCEYVKLSHVLIVFHLFYHFLYLIASFLRTLVIMLLLVWDTYRLSSMERMFLKTIQETHYE